MAIKLLLVIFLFSISFFGGYYTLEYISRLIKKRNDKNK